MNQSKRPRHYAAEIVKKLRHDWKKHPNDLTEDEWNQLLASTPTSWSELVQLHVVHTALRAPYIKKK